jgi:hypothetical protein
MKRPSHRLTGQTTIVRKADGLLSTRVDGELVAMSIDKGLCYGLNAPGVRIWDLIAEPCSLDRVCSQLLAEFDVDEAVCRRQVTALVAAMAAEGLVEVRKD